MKKKTSPDEPVSKNKISPAKRLRKLIIGIPIAVWIIIFVILPLLVVVQYSLYFKVDAQMDKEHNHAAELCGVFYKPYISADILQDYFLCADDIMHKSSTGVSACISGVTQNKTVPQPVLSADTRTSLGKLPG